MAGSGAGWDSGKPIKAITAMAVEGQLRNRALAALMIAPDRELANQFAAADACRNSFEVVSELKSYPTEQTLEIRLRQTNPDVVLLDVNSNTERAMALVEHLTRVRFDVSTVALDLSSRPDVVLRSLRAGASEYLFSPFDETNTLEAVSRLLRLRKPDVVREDELGAVIAFSSVKPGSGSSTLAVQSAFALQRGTQQRVLLMDLDTTGGSIGFSLRLNMDHSIEELATARETLSISSWREHVTCCEGVDILPGPALPSDEPADPARLQSVLDFARTMYDWIVVDLPAVPHRTALIGMSQADRVFLISTAELASLHLARRAVRTLEQLGFADGRSQLVVNRVDSRAKMTTGELAKLLRCSVYGVVPNDYFTVHRAVTLGGALSKTTALGCAIEDLASHTVQTMAAARKQMAEAAAGAAPAYSLS
jgi:pilus assembly protein CpaE